MAGTDPVSVRLAFFVHNLLDRNHDGNIDSTEAAPEQIAKLLGKSDGKKVETASDEEIVNNAWSKYGNDTSGLASFFTSVFRNPNLNRMDFSAHSAAALGHQLGLTFHDCAVTSESFQASLFHYLQGETPPRPTYDAARPTSAEATDPWTNSNYLKVPVTHVDLDLTIDFDWRRFQGVATYTLGKQGEQQLVLDTTGIEVNHVWVIPAGSKERREVSFTWGSADKMKGRALVIPFPADTAVAKVVVEYETAVENRSRSITWMRPEQTSGGRRPFVYTQGAPQVFARGWIPIQDTPAARITMDAKLRVKHDLGIKALMSKTGESRGHVPHPQRQGAYDVWSWKVAEPVPAYVIAIAAGDLEARPLGRRSVLYAEPTFMAAAAREFKVMERYLATEEKIFGPLPYGQPDVLVMPPSFVYGGMENLGLNFLSNTVLTGDGSAMGDPLHEAIHNLFGNRVTYRRIEDEWLIEAFTMYAQRLVQEEVDGPQANAIAAVNGQSLLNQYHFDDTSGSQLTCLATAFPHEDPVDGVGHLLYRKTWLLTQWLERRIGRDALVAFLKKYVEHFAGQAITTQDFINFFATETGVKPEELDEWLYGPELPQDAPVFTSPQIDRVNETVAAWQGDATHSSLIPDAAAWRPEMWVLFLQKLAGGPVLTRAALDALRSTYKLDDVTNPEIQAYWYALVAKHRYEPSYPGLERYLDGRWGRVRYLVQVFRGFKAGGDMEYGARLYQALRPKLHDFSWNWLDPLFAKK